MSEPCTGYSNLAFLDELDDIYHSAETQDVATMFQPQLDGMVAGTSTSTDSATAMDKIQTCLRESELHQAAQLPPTLSQDAFNVFDIQLLPPERKEMSEKYNFEVSIMESKIRTTNFLLRAQKPDVSKLDPNVKVSNGVIFSPLFNRIYVSIDDFTNKYLKIKFAYAPTTEQPLFVRLTPAFAEESERVEICLTHQDMIKNKEPEESCNHLIHSVSTHNTVHYLGDPSQPASHYSIVIDFTNTTEEYLWNEFKFVCANSCTPIKKRGSTILIYELLDAFGHVYSRKIMNLCICQNISRAYKTELKKYKRGIKRSRTNSGGTDDHVEKKIKTGNCEAKKRLSSPSTTQNDRIPVDINEAQSANVSHCTKEILEAHISVITALAASINDSEIQSDYKTFLQKLKEHRTNIEYA